MKRFSLFLLLLPALPWVGGCAPAGGDAEPGAEPPLLVFAAAGLRDAMEELIPLYEAGIGREVDLVLGSSGNLATQIENGAPAHLFLAADRAFIEPLEEAGLVEEGSRRIVGVGRVALVWREGLSPPGGLEVLAAGDPPTVSVANPELAPYGAAARGILQEAQLWEGVRSRMVMGENVSQALQFVESGNADYGLVALSLVRGSRPREHLVLPDAPHRPLEQVGVVLRHTGREQEARELMAFILSPRGQTLLGSYGFEAPDS